MHGLQCSLPHFHSLVREGFVHILTYICTFITQVHIFGELRII